MYGFLKKTILYLSKHKKYYIIFQFKNFLYPEIVGNHIASLIIKDLFCKQTKQNSQRNYS